MAGHPGSPSGAGPMQSLVPVLPPPQQQCHGPAGSGACGSSLCTAPRGELPGSSGAWSGLCQGFAHFSPCPVPARCRTRGLATHPRLRRGRSDALSAAAWGRAAAPERLLRLARRPRDPLSRAGPSITRARSSRWGPAAPRPGAAAGVQAARRGRGAALPPRSRWMSPAIWTVRGRRRTAPARAWAAGAMEAASSGAPAWGTSPGPVLLWRRALV